MTKKLKPSVLFVVGRVIAAFTLLISASSVQAQTFSGPITCGELSIAGRYGPFDYRTVPPDILHRVEDYHFTPLVESGRGGSTATRAGHDLAYTLFAFPNSPRGLLAILRYAEKMKTERPPDLNWPAECYFDRAIRFVPDDPLPHLLYARFLKDWRRPAEARAQLEEAQRLRKDPLSFEFDYNSGLLYYELGDYAKAAQSAQLAYALGAPFPSLKEKLKAKKAWND